jgi:hypothetical protein
MTTIDLGKVVGDTGPRGPKGDTGPSYVLTNTDRAEIAELVNIPPATTLSAGLVKPDGTTIVVDANGTISLGIPAANGVSF